MEKLHILENELSWEGCAALGVTLKANDFLKELVLDMNPLGDEGVAALTDGLRWNACLEVLMRAYNIRPSLHQLLSLYPAGTFTPVLWDRSLWGKRSGSGCGGERLLYGQVSDRDLLVIYKGITSYL